MSLFSFYVPLILSAGKFTRLPATPSWISRPRQLIGVGAAPGPSAAARRLPPQQRR